MNDDKKTGVIAKLGGRKFLIVLMAFAGCTYVVLTETKVPDSVLEFLKWVIGMYFTANPVKSALDKIAIIKSANPDLTTTQAAGQAVTAQITQLQAQLQALIDALKKPAE